MGADTLTVQYAWPVGKPLVDNLGDGIWEVCSRLENRMARTLFAMVNQELSCCTDSSRKHRKRQPMNSTGEETQKTIFTKSMSKQKHRGGDLRDFLNEQGILGEVEARALKQAISLQFNHLLEKQSLTKAEMATRMKTSRAAVDRLLDATNTSITLTTLGKAASALGRKI